MTAAVQSSYVWQRASSNVLVEALTVATLSHAILHAEHYENEAHGTRFGFALNYALTMARVQEMLLPWSYR